MYMPKFYGESEWPKIRDQLNISETKNVSHYKYIYQFE